MSRKFTSFAENIPKTKALVDELPSLKGDVESYRARMIQLGAYLADSLIPKLGGELSKDICVICTVEDADFLARGNARFRTLWRCRPFSSGRARAGTACLPGRKRIAPALAGSGFVFHPGNRLRSGPELHGDLAVLA